MTTIFTNTQALLISFRLGARSVFAERAALVGQLLIYAVLVLSYNVLFHGIAPGALARFGLSPAALVWYFVTTQVIIGCTYYHYRELELEIRSGGLDTLLLRPLPFWRTKMAEWAGQFTARLAIIAPLGFAMALACGNPLPPHFAALLPLVLGSLWLGGLMFLGWHFMVACAVLWAGQSEPVYRFWQKTLFFVGARSWPLLIYPLWAQAIIWWTPFPAILAVPAGLLIHPALRQIGHDLGVQICWVGATLVACAYTAKLVRAHVLRLGA
jgi:ABC-2 type transport system permease protein